MTESRVSVALVSFGYPPRAATAIVIEQTPGERLVRAMAGLGAFWGLALIGLFIPLAHFILVPSFGIGGVIIAAKRAREDRRLAGVHGECPRCGVSQEFTVSGRFVDGRSFDCPKCHGNLTLAVTPT